MQLWKVRCQKGSFFDRLGHLNTLESVVRWFPEEVLQLRDDEGKSVLQVAVEHQNLECVHFLLRHNAPVRTSDHSGSSPLFAAISNGDKACVDLLLEHGKLNALLQTDKDGNTPLFAVLLLRKTELLGSVFHYLDKEELNYLVSSKLLT